MYYQNEQARTAATALQAAQQLFSVSLSGGSDAVFLGGERARVFAATGLPFAMPVCDRLRRDEKIRALLAACPGSILFDFSQGFACRGEKGELAADAELARRAINVYHRVAAAPGTLNGNGELALDLQCCPVGPHYNVNLLLGWRAGYPAPLFTTPKSAVDAFGRGSFRAGGPAQVLASRCVLQPEENGEPVNRQFYLYENGRQIFYSLDAFTNTRSAHCLHSQNRTTITHETRDGLKITRTIFLPMQQPGMPDALEIQHITVENLTDAPRNIKIVLTGEFGIAGPETVANDVVYANVVHQSEVVYEENHPLCLTLHHRPADQKGEKKFALLLADGAPMDDFCCNLAEFIGNGSLAAPELGDCLPSRQHRKMAPFFAMGKTLALPARATKTVDSFVGMMDRREDVTVPFDEALHTLVTHYRAPGAVAAALRGVVDFQNDYTAYFTPETSDAGFNAYTGKNLPFQVLYQTFVSRAFAWTQKSYRETGFREIQDVFASLPYLQAAGHADLARELISAWAVNVFRMGYAYHDFTWRGKEPGDCSDDALWLTQAVARYCRLSGDYAFLREKLPIAGEDASRPLADTLMAILTYSGKISVGAHGLPLLDKADWNDTLRLDKNVMKGPEKEALYRAQLAKSGKPYGTPLENTLTESVMNACLLKIAADETAALLQTLDAAAYADEIAEAEEIARKTGQSVQKNAWKQNFFARALINDGREGGYTYLGAAGDGLSADEALDGSYFLNSFGWSILAGIATESQIETMLGVVEKHLKTEAGLRLCTLVAYPRLGCNTATGLYYPGDRENGGVFKHAAMMSTTAMLEAAKWVTSEALAARLTELAWWMIGKTLPCGTMRTPFITKGNPRFCTQYNNSETGENIGPMLSGTASWLTLALREGFGLAEDGARLEIAPALPAALPELSYTLRKNGAALRVQITRAAHCRAAADTRRLLDGAPCPAQFAFPTEGEHTLTLEL
jgi:cellobiose phosphorylase